MTSAYEYLKSMEGDTQPTSLHGALDALNGEIGDGLLSLSSAEWAALRAYVKKLENELFMTNLDLKEENKHLKSVIAYMKQDESYMQHMLLIAENK